VRGTVVKRGKSWSVVVEFGRGPDGKRIRKWHSGYRTRKAAEQARTKLLTALDEGMYVAPTNVTLGVFLTEKWLPAISATVRPTTAALYRTNVEAHIVPKLGPIALRNLGPDALNRFYAEALTSGRCDGRGGLSTRTVRILHVILHRALRDATKWGITARNVAELADPPKVKTREMACWSPEQTTAFLASTADDRMAALWHLAASTGMRRGEILGLRWSDVDLDAATLTIRQTIVVVDSKPVLSEPKTGAGRRTLALDPATVTALRSHRARQAQERLAWGAAWQDVGLVFVREDGQLVNPERLSKWFGRRAKSAGLPRITFHGLRHSYVTMLLRDGQPLRTVAQRAGHSSPNVTSAIHAHVLPGDDEAAALAGARLLQSG
jgi:integrase